MKTYDLALVPGTDTRLNIDYKFLLVLADGGYTFDVSLFKGSGFQKCEGVSAGFGLRLDGNNRGRELFFSSVNAQTIKVFVGDDEAIYQRLSGNVTVNGGTLATLNSITNTVKVVQDGLAYGSSWKSRTNMAANSAVTILAPAANLNGVIVNSLRYSAYGAGDIYQALIAHTAAPTDLVTGDVLSSTNAWQAVNTNTFGIMTMEMPIFVPAGKGLYVISTIAETGKMGSLLYTLK